MNTRRLVISVCAVLSVAIVTSVAPWSSEAQFSSPQSAFAGHANKVKSPDHLNIDWAQWPAGTTNQSGFVVENNQMDNPQYNEDALYHHSLTYVAAGMVGGYMQMGNFPLGTGGPTGVAMWQPTYFPDAAAARALVADTAAYLASLKITSKPCAPDWDGCLLYNMVLGTGAHRYGVVYALFQDDNAVEETSIDAPLSVTGNQSQNDALISDELLLARAGAAVVHAADVEPTATSTPVRKSTNKKCKKGYKLVHGKCRKQKKH